MKQSDLSTNLSIAVSVKLVRSSSLTGILFPTEQNLLECSQVTLPPDIKTFDSKVASNPEQLAAVKSILCGQSGSAPYLVSSVSSLKVCNHYDCRCSDHQVPGRRPAWLKVSSKYGRRCLAASWRRPPATLRRINWPPTSPAPSPQTSYSGSTPPPGHSSLCRRDFITSAISAISATSFPPSLK